MPLPLLNLHREYAELQGEAETAVLRVLRSGQYILGENVFAFEAEFASFVGTRRAVSVANGTDALVIALKALGIGPGDEVITSPYTFFATAESIAAVGATPVFCDVRRDTYNIDPEKLAPLITEKTKAVMPVHIFGQCADMDKINTVAKRNGLFVIEDACQAAGAWYKGRMAGSLADIACFSFFPTKNLACAGDGGMIVTDYDCLADICRGLRAHGSGEDGRRAAELMARAKADKAFYRKGATDLSAGAGNSAQTAAASPTAHTAEKGSGEDHAPPVVSSKYYNYLVGYNSRLDELQAALLRVKLRVLDKSIEGRRRAAAYYDSALKGLNGITLPYASPNGTHAYHLYVLLSEQRDALRDHLGQKGIATGVYYPVPLHRQRVFEPLNYREGSLPEAEYLSKRALAIPLFAHITEEEQQEVAAAIKEFCG